MRIDSPIVCASSATCSMDTSARYRGCSTSGLTFYSACFDFWAATSCLGNTVCSQDPRIKLWQVFKMPLLYNVRLIRYSTGTAAPYCNTMTFTDISYTRRICGATNKVIEASVTGAPPPKPRLSVGAKIGIGIGVGLGTPAAAFIIAFFCIPSFRRRVMQYFVHHEETHVGDVSGNWIRGNNLGGNLATGGVQGGMAAVDGNSATIPPVSR